MTNGQVGLNTGGIMRKVVFLIIVLVAGVTALFLLVGIAAAGPLPQHAQAGNDPYYY